MKTTRIQTNLLARTTRTVLSAAALLALGSPAPGVVKDWNVSTGMWNVGGNWLPNGAPGGLDSVLIGSTAAAQNGTVTLNVNPSIAGLTLNDGMTLDTNSQSMLVGTTASVSGQNTVGSTTFSSRLMVRSAAGTFGFKTLNNLNITSGARMDLSGGRVDVGSVLFVDGASRVGGTGTINLTGGGSTAMTLDGDLVVGVGSLTINQNGVGRVDLDGGAILDNRIDVTAGNLLTNQYASLTVTGDGLADTFDDSLRVGGRNTVNMNLANGWTMSSGTLEFSDNTLSPGPAVLNGSTLTMNTAISVIGTNSVGQINSPAVLNPFSRASVNAGNALEFNGPVTINGGTYTAAQGGRIDFNGPVTLKGGRLASFSIVPADGSVVFGNDTSYAGTLNFGGIVSQNGDTTVNDYTVVNAEVLDIDGFTGQTTWNINAGLVINAGTIELPTSLAPEFNGTINVNHVGGILGTQGGLTFNLPAGDAWTMAGTLSLQGDSFGFSTATLAGSHVHIAGAATVGNAAALEARVSFDAPAAVNILNFSSLSLEGGSPVGPNEIAGGVIGGPGYLLATTGHSLVGNGTINSNINFETGADLYARDGKLTLGGVIAHVGYIGTINPAGILHVNNPWDTAVATALVVSGGTVGGATITNGGLTYGSGTINSTGFINNGSLSVFTGQTLVLDTTGAPDLDGVSSTGQLYVDGTMMRIVKTPTDAFDGTATVGDLATLRFENGWTLGSGGTLNLTGVAGAPATVAGSLQNVFGRVNVKGPGSFDIGTNFVGSSVLSIPLATDELTLEQGAFIGASVNVSGNGKLRVAHTANLSPAPNAGVNVNVVNQGTVFPGGFATIGAVGVKSYQQASDGKLAVEIAGPSAGTQHDKLNVTAGASLDGNLALSVLNLYNPAYLASHEILHTGGARTGTFDTITGMIVSPTKYLAVTYDADSVFVTAALPGDANLSGAVDIDDFAILASNFNLQGTWAGGNFNGDLNTDIDDFGLLATNFNTGVPGGLASRGSAVPEPGFVGILVAGTLLRRRRIDPADRT